MDYDDQAGGDEFIFCEGCGARLYATDRVCPKCSRPAPGILSTSSAASDLAAGKTASFPKLTVVGGAAAEKSPSSAPEILAESLDPSKTEVLSAEQLAAAGSAPARADARSGSREAKRRGKRAAKAAYTEPRELTEADFDRPRRWRWLVPTIALAAVVLGAWFVVEDPLGVMPGLYERFAQAASEAFPSRYDTSDEADDADGDEDEEAEDEPAAITEATLSEAEAFSRLTALYEQIVAFQDQIGDVVADYNAYYIANDYSKRATASESAYAMREDVQAVLDELEALQLAEDSAYEEDRANLIQLATWMYNRVNVLCESWDISLALDEDESASEHRSEIVKPLIEVLDAEGVNQDVVQFETYLYAWAPTEKTE